MQEIVVLERVGRQADLSISNFMAHPHAHPHQHEQEEMHCQDSDGDGEDDKQSLDVNVGANGSEILLGSQGPLALFQRHRGECRKDDRLKHSLSRFDEANLKSLFRVHVDIRPWFAGSRFVMSNLDSRDYTTLKLTQQISLSFFGTEQLPP